MNFADLLKLALRNLREAKLRAALTTMGVVVGVAMIVTMVSFGLGLQRNTITRFRQLDLLSEINVFGKSLAALAAGPSEAAPDANASRTGSNNGTNQPDGSERNREPRESRGQPNKAPERVLDDAALAELRKIPGVESIEPVIILTVYVRSNGRARVRSVGAATIPNDATRFKEFAAGRMMTASDGSEAIVDERFVKNFGFTDAAAALGQRIEFLAPPAAHAEDEPNIMGVPLQEERADDSGAAQLVAKTFTIVGVLKSTDALGQPRFRGLTPASDLYIELQAARTWRKQHRDNLGEVALQLAQQGGSLKAGADAGYGSAVLRVSDPAVVPEVRRKIDALGFGSFSIMDQLEQIRVIFLIVNSALGLLGGISLLVASFGIANTMIMSILERTREIGIMKAIGAEDREIRLIFFTEAAVIGFAGGVLGCLLALGIDTLANRLAFRFLLQPQGVSFVDFFAIPPYLWLGAIGFAVVVSILAALYPATRAARIDPVAALRHG